MARHGIIPKNGGRARNMVCLVYAEDMAPERHRVWKLRAEDTLSRSEYILAKYEVEVTAEVVERTAVRDVKLSGRKDVAIVGPSCADWIERRECCFVMYYSVHDVQRAIELMAACNV